LNPAILRAIAGNTVRELVRSKLLYNLLLFAVLLIAGSLFVSELTIADFDRIIIDLGLVAIELVGSLLAVLIGVSVVAGEIERRTIFPTLAKPISRATFLLGRYAGLFAILVVNVLVMLGALALVLRLAGYSLSATAAAAAALIVIELAVLAAMAVFFASFTTPILAAAFSFAFFLIGHLLSDVRAYGSRSKSEAAKVLTSAVYRALPDLELFNLKWHAANKLAVPAGFASSAALYGLLYTATLLLLAIAVFGRRDLK
jgi:ABC-type transport system involved in multi-copper enzyme maturation permease subunit